MRELMKKVATVWPWLAAILSGLLCTLCFPPFDQSWFCWFALTPLIAAVWFSGSSISKLLASWFIVSFSRLPRRLLCVLELVCWLDRAPQFPGFVAKFAVSVFSCIRVDRARMGPRLVVRRFWLGAWR